MPRLQDSPEEAAFREKLRGWLSENVPNIEGRDVDALKAWQKRLFDAGWLGLNWPKNYGGQGASFREQVVYNEEVIRAKTPTPINGIGLMIVGPTLIAVGNEEQKKRYLAPILSAAEIWCQGFSEPNAGSDLAGLQTKAISDGDDYVITGQKIWTSNSRIADFIFLLVRTDPDAPRHKGITAVIVDMKTPGVSVKPLRQITGDAEFGEVFFDEVRVPKSNRIGDENDGWIVAMKTFTRERANISVSTSVRLQQQCDNLVSAVKGRDTPVDPQLRRHVAQAYLDAECLNLTCERLSEQLFGFESSLVKVVGSEINQRLQELGMGTLGPDAPLIPTGDFEKTWQFGFMRSRGNTIEGGTSEILRGIIAERILGLPRN